MELVINIDDKIYEEIKNRNNICSIYIPHAYASIYAIENGTPLPKGHGRLIDADALNRKDVNCANVPMNFIDIASTIIEADKS